MRVARLVISLLVLFAFPTTSALAEDASPASNSGTSDGWIQPPEIWYQAGSHGVIFNEQPVSLPWSALIQQNLIPAEYLSAGVSPQDPTCEAVSSKKCDSNAFRTFRAVIPVCTQKTDINCIESLKATGIDAAISSANFVDYFPKKPLNAFVGDAKLHVPDGSSTSIWSIPKYPHAGGDLYLVNVAVQGDISSPFIPAKINNFEMSIWPVSFVNRTICGPDSKSFANCDAGWQFDANYSYKNFWNSTEGFGSDGVHNCVAKSLDRCAQKFAFPSNVRFTVKIRTNTLPAGWLHGRMTDPQISITSADGYSDLEVSALPTQVPIVAARYQWDEMPAALRDLYSTKTGAFLQDGGNTSGIMTSFADPPAGREDPHLRSYWSQPMSSGTNGLAELSAWLPYVKNTATASSSVWRLRTLSANEIYGADPCFTDSSKVTGIVTTNATEYSAGPPSFNSIESTLNYKVGAPHFKSDSSIFNGNYDLVMRSDVARCLYDFSKAPVSAKIEILSEDGSPQVATTSLSEKDGWLHLAASGFTYSSPTLKVKLEQIQPAAPTPVASTPVTEISVGVSKTIPRAAPIQKSITCVKGKTIKKVTAVNPKCPVGYKKK